jgi:hypothetical protein
MTALLRGSVLASAALLACGGGYGAMRLNARMGHPPQEPPRYDPPRYDPPAQPNPPAQPDRRDAIPRGEVAPPAEEKREPAALAVCPAGQHVETGGGCVVDGAPPDEGALPHRVGPCGCATDDLMCAMRCAAAQQGDAGAPPACACAPSDPSCKCAAQREFDRSAAVTALSAAAASAKACKQPGGPTGSGRVKVNYAPSGRVSTASVDNPPFAGTAVGACVAAAFRRASVPAFDGASVSVAKSFSIE